MDWQGIESGLRKWFAAASGIALDDVTWQGAPEGMMGRPCAYLNILANASGVGTDEQRVEGQGAGKDARVRLTGNRRFTLSCRVASRSQLLDERAMVYLERVRDAMMLPSTQAVFRSLNIGFIECAALVPLRQTRAKRVESVASMDILCSGALDAATSETVGTIERVRVGGTVNETITVPQRTIP